MAVCFPLLMCFTGQNELLANPMGGEVVSGQASFNATGNTLTVTNTPGTIINWQGFSINANEVTRFAQQSAASAVLNRVVTNNPSVILGTLSSNGQVYLVNPGGIVFGAGSTVDVAGLVATSLNLSDADFLAGRHNFTNQPGAQNISNAGSITAQQGGQIYLIAPNVENTGIITAPDGEILLAAGHEVQLVNSLDPSLRVSITAPAGDATNVGQLVVESGSLGLFGTVVKNTGTASADSATLQGGKIVFKASQRAEITGTVIANGTTGGTIQVLGNEVGIMDGATVSANGTNGGGVILVGGDKQGANPDVQNAQVTYVAPTATISADGGLIPPFDKGGQGGFSGVGNGGKVIIWADDTARIYGSISATGGAVGGNGGFVETSGKRYLDVTSAPNVSAPAGRGGQWLLDPHNVTIQAGPGNMDTIDVLAPYFIPAAIDNSTLDVAVINAALNAETTIEVTTGSTGLQLGTITVAAPITKTAGVGIGTLTLIAANEIFINADITASSGQIQFNTGASQVDVNANITLNGGSWDATGGGATVRVDSGAPIINSPLYTGTVNVSAGTATFNGNMFLTNLNVSGGTLTGSGAISIPNTGTFNWTGNSVLAGSGTLTTQAGSTTTLTPGFAQTVALRGSRVWDNSGAVTFTPNAGTLSYFEIDDTTADGTAVFNNQTGAQFNINASFNDTHTIGVGTFNNAGTLNKNLNGTAAASGFVPAFNNLFGGTVNVNSGTLRFDTGGTDAGNYVLTNGATLQFHGGPRSISGNIGGTGNVTFSKPLTATAVYTLTGDYSISGTTTAALDSLGTGTLAFNGTVTNLGTGYIQSGGVTNVSFTGMTSGAATGFQNLASIAVNDGSVTFANGTSFSGLTSLTQGGGGTLDFGNNSISVNTLNMTSGTLTGSGNITVTTGGSFNWGGSFNATIAGSGILTTQSGVTTNVTPGFARTTSLRGSRVWDNFGAVTFTPDAGTLSYFEIDDTVVDGTAVFNNKAGGLFNVNASTTDTHTIGVGTFNNEGEFRKSLNTSVVTSTFTPAFNNLPGGTVNINSGTFSVTGGLTQSGLIEVAAGATFSKAGGFSNSITGILAGAGTISVGVGNSLGNSGTISPGMTGGDATGTLSIIGNLSMNASSILNIDINSPLAGDYDILQLNPGMAGNLAGTLNLSGVAPAGSYSIFSSTGGMFGTFATVNSGTFTQTPTYDAGNQLVTLTVTANTNVATAYWTGIAADFNWATAGNWSSGIAPIAGDKVYIGGGAGTVNYTPTAGQVGAIISDGALNFVAGDLTVANASTFNGVASFNGGTLTLNGGSTFNSVSVASAASALTLNGPATSVNSLNISVGSLTFGGPSTVNKMNMTGGTLTDNFGFAINGSFDWSGGTITSAAGSIFTTSVATTTTITGNAVILDNIWHNNGTVNFNGTGNLSLGGAGVAATTFINQTSGALNLNGSSATPIQWGTIITNKAFLNFGTLSKNSGSAATQTSDLLAINNGTVKVQSGTLAFPNFTTNDGRISVASGATFSTGAFTNSYYWNGSIWVTGVLEGAGTINVGAGMITNNGIIAPGVSGGDTTGTLSITGNVLMGATGQLNFDLNGVSAGNYDVLAISGTADITTANINLKGFGDTGTYTVLTTGGLTGTGTINPGYFTQTPTYTASNLSLGVTGNSLVNAIFWDGGAGTYNWADALNWSANVLPTATDNIYIATLGANSLLINSGAGLGNNFVCDANFQLAGGGLTLDGTAFFNGVSNISGGTFSTAGATQMGTLNWTGGTITGAGVLNVSSLNMPAGTALNGVNATNLNGKTMNVNGNTGFSSGAANGNNGADLTLLNAAIINNKGIWSIDNIANIVAGTGGGTFNNFGEVRVGQTVAATATISTVFNNDNTIFLDLVYGANISNGNLIIAGGGSSIFDAFNTQAGTTIEFTNGYNFNVGGNFGLGDLILSGGQVNSASLLRAENITIAGAVTSSGTLSLAANNNILLAAGSSISSSSGALNINLNSDFNGAAGGGIYLDTGSSINSNGGNISMGGMPSVGNAIGNGTVTGGKTFDSGIYVLGDITAGAGNVTMRGEGRAFGSGSNHLADGITFAGGLLSSNGIVDINGVAHVLSASTAGSDVTAGVDFLGAGIRLSTQTGTVTVTGLNDAGAGFCRAQGITVETGTIIETTGTGTLTLNGTSTGFDTGWGVGIFGGTVRTTAAGGGAITLNGINLTNPDGGVVISDGNVLSSGGEIRIIGAGLGGSGTLGVSTIGGASSGNILIRANDSGPIGFNTTSSINAGSNTLTLMLAGGSITDNGSSMINAGSLRLLGTGTFNLGGSGNNVGTLAANVTGSVTYNDTNGFAIGSVTSFDGTAGTTTTGVTTGNSNFTGTTAGSITLNAGSAINTGTANVTLASTAGNFINNSGSATPITAASGKIYSTGPASNIKGGVVPAFSIFNCAYPGACGAPATGIGFLYTQATAPTLTIIADALSKVYGSSDPALTYALSGLVGDDLSSIVTGAQSRVAGENAGTYAISQGTLNVPAGYGYTLNYTGNNLTITPALLTLNLSANNASKTYGMTYNFAGTEFTPVGLIPGDTITGVTLTSTGAVGTANAGAYSIDITPGSEVFGQGLASNYNIINYIPGTLTVNPAPLTVSANAQSKVYGNIDPALTYTPTGLLFADTLTGSLSRVAGENVGSYAITQGTLSNPNYSISYTGNNLSITQRIIAIIASASSKVYGSADPNLFTVGGSGLASWDTNGTAFTGSLNHAGGENVGSYAIAQGTLAANSNYSVSGFTGNTLTITPAALTVAGVPVNKVLGTPDPALTYTTSGLQFSDTAATVLNGGSLARDPGETIGSYLVNQGTLALVSANYIMTYVPCNFTILAPTVVQEITQMSLQNTPQGDTATTAAEDTTTAEDEKKQAAQAAAEAEVVADTGNANAESLPVCR